MNSARLQTLALVVLLSPQLVCGAAIRSSFDNIEELIGWSNDSFFGGYEAHELERDDKELLVVVGMPTSGFPTSQIFVYQKRGEGYHIVAFRNTVSGIAAVEDDDEAIVVDVDGVSVLSVAWESIGCER